MHYFNWYLNVANKLEKGCPEAEGTNTGQFLAMGTSHPYREKKQPRSISNLILALRKHFLI